MNRMSFLRGIAAMVMLLASSSVSRGFEGDLSLSKLPVKEVTVFKDGHAFVLHEGVVRLDTEGRVRLDELPAPIMGAFWAASADDRVRLKGVVAGKQRVPVRRPALELKDLIEGNIGRAVVVTDVDGVGFPATIEDASYAHPAADAPGTAPPSPSSVKGNELVAFRLADGVRVMPLNRVRELTFPEGHSPALTREEERNVLTLSFAPVDQGQRYAPRLPETAAVGMGYVQRGLRWIPSYRLEVTGEGTAKVNMQATLINELADLDEAAVHLVIGVPTFRFKDTLDPMSMQQALAQLSPYFREATDPRGTPNFLSNAIMSQTARMGEYSGAGHGAADATGDVGDVNVPGESVEDLFVWTLERVTLRKGERMVLPIVAFEIPCEDRYILEIPIAPLPEMRQQFQSQYEAELARLLAAPKVMHRLRLTNSATHPLTTAPVLMIRQGRPLGQGMMTYTAPRGTTEVEITAAVGIGVSKSELEIERLLGAKVWRGDHYDRVSLEGTVTLTNYRAHAVEVHVRRYVIGHCDRVGQDGEAKMQNVLELAPAATSGAGVPTWWRWYSWPWWWWRMNGAIELSWDVPLEPNQTRELNYAWHYYYRP
ncbi:MAG: hypothetical protein FLDDKLPJ_01834 [Phycisphaerae bacterium]|nr:hypothetical protein [Phycisphaerae bacterium]